MGKLLFRAKRLDTEKWEESETYLVIKSSLGEAKYVYLSAHSCVLIEYDDFGNLKEISADFEGDCIYYKVDPFTLGQYTETDDKKGNRIFEGDIVYDEFVDEYAIITFQAGSFWVEYPKAHCNILHKIAHSLIVKGNMYDNPELYALAIGGEDK